MGTLLSSCHVRLWPIKSMGAGNITPAWESVGWESIGCILRVPPHRPFDRQPPTSTAQPGDASAHRPELHRDKMRSAKKRGGEGRENSTIRAARGHGDATRVGSHPGRSAWAAAGPTVQLLT